MILESGFCCSFILVNNGNTERDKCNISSHVLLTELLGQLHSLKTLQIISVKKRKKLFSWVSQLHWKACLQSSESKYYSETFFITTKEFGPSLFIVLI